MFHEATGRVVARRRRGNLSCETLLGDDRRLVKRYRLAHAGWRLRKPWRREHKVLARLSGLGFPESLGYTERPLPAGREIVFVCVQPAGEPLSTAADVREADLPRLAAMWGAMHRHGVVAGHARASGHLRRPDGSLVFVDFDRGRALRRGTPWFYVRVGRDLAALCRDTLAQNAARFAGFLDAYHLCAAHPAAWRPVIRIGMALEAGVRALMSRVQLGPRRSAEHT